MAQIGEYRLRIYDLLYKRPVCDYTKVEGGRRQSHVLILGSGWAGNEAFKAVFWAGQALDTDLCVTVASQNAPEYQKQVLSPILPALQLYAEEKHYADLRFIPIDVEEGLDEAGLSPLDNDHFTYVIIALGDAEHNWLAATELITREGARKSGNERVLVSVFDEFSESIDEDERNMLLQHGEENGIEVCFFGKETDSDPDLDRIARNINFSYGMKYDQRMHKNQADQQFESSRIAEFVKSPMDYEVGDVGMVANFIGSNYAADSSYAAAVHIPVKLAMCRLEEPDTDPFDTLEDAIQKKNRLYWRLTALEHRRWNAYMVMRGYRAPSREEEETVLYHDGNTHQDKKRLLHLCLCDCAETSSLKNNFDRQYDNWCKKGCPQDDPSELERAGLRAHQLTDRLTRDLDADMILDLVRGDKKEYVNLRHSIQKLFNDEVNSTVLYQKSLDRAIGYASSVSGEELDRIREADRLLLPVKTRNARMDFFGLDEQLVEMTPFVLWYGQKYETVITFTDGLSTATQDVVVPTLLCARRAVFIGRTVKNKRYQKAILSYFESRGANTTPEFIVLETMTTENVFECLDKQMNRFGENRDLVINCVSNKEFAAMLAIGRMIEKYPDSIRVVQYNPDKGIISLSADRNFGAGLDNKSFSLSEYIHLMGGRVENEFASHYDYKEYEFLTELFRKYSVPQKYKKPDGSSGSIHTWALVTGFISRAAKDENYGNLMNDDTSEEELEYTGIFTTDVFRSARIGKTLRQLRLYHIIWMYQEMIGKERVTISFHYCNPDIALLLGRFEEGNIQKEDSFRSMKFIPLNGGLKLANRFVTDAPLQEKPEETETHQKIKIEFLKSLEKKKYITDLIIKPDHTVSFAFKDEMTMSLLKTQGAVFELVVYFLMRESGNYDEVETGVKVAWDEEDISREQKLIDELNESGTYGYQAYIKAYRELLRRMADKDAQSVKNEIDIIAIKGMKVIMVSCKTSASDNMQWIYEIRAVSDHFQSKGIMAVSSDYSGNSGAAFKERAKQMKIALWGTDTLWDEKERDRAMKRVI